MIKLIRSIFLKKLFKNLPQKLLFTTPEIYLNGLLHLGHCFEVVVTDISCRFFKSLGLISEYFLNYHVSGLPIPVLYENWQSFKLDHNLQDIRSISDLLIYLRSINNQTLETLKIGLNLELMHFTGEYQPLVDNFVKWQYRVLEKNNLIIKKDHSIRWCNSCKIPLGDHDCKEGEGVFLTKAKFLTIGLRNNLQIAIVVNDQNKDITNETILLPEDRNFYWIEDFFSLKNILVAEHLLELKKFKIFQTGAKKISLELIKDNLEDLGYQVILSKTINWPSIKNAQKTTSKGSKWFLKEQVRCKRGHLASIKKLKNQWSIDYANSQWKDRVLDLVKEINITSQVRDQLSYYIKNLKAYPFLRRDGIGTRLKQYDNFVADSLSDSCIFMFVTSLWGKVTIETSSKFEFWDYLFDLTDSAPDDLSREIKEKYFFRDVFSYVIGKDLLTNHFIFSLYFFSLFKRKYFNVNFHGHCLINNEKMSKTKKNCLPVAKIIEKMTISPLNLRLLVATLTTDNYQDFNFDYRLLFKKKNLKSFSLIKEFFKIKNNQLKICWTRSNSTTLSANILDHWLIFKLYKLELKTIESMIKIQTKGVWLKWLHFWLDFKWIRSLRKNKENGYFDIYFFEAIASIFKIFLGQETNPEDLVYNRIRFINLAKNPLLTEEKKYHLIYQSKSYFTKIDWLIRNFQETFRWSKKKQIKSITLRHYKNCKVIVLAKELLNQLKDWFKSASIFYKEVDSNQNIRYFFEVEFTK